MAPVRPISGPLEPHPLRIAGEEPPAVGLFGYYSQFASEHVIAAVETYIRQHGKSHRELAVMAEADPTTFTLFLQHKFRSNWPELTFKADALLRRLYSRLHREADCLQVLADLLKETGVPQLWTATGDLRRYLDRRVGQWRDPFAQIRSRITHKIDLGEARGALICPDDVRELTGCKFGLKLDAVAARNLAGLATVDNEGSLRQHDADQAGHH